MKKIIYLLILIPLFCSIAYAKTVIDQTGRKLIIPDNPQKVISLAPNITEIIFAIKEEKRLIAATTHSDYPPRANKLYKIGSYTRFDIEKIISSIKVEMNNNHIDDKEILFSLEKLEYSFKAKVAFIQRFKSTSTP